MTLWTIENLFPFDKLSEGTAESVSNVLLCSRRTRIVSALLQQSERKVHFTNVRSLAAELKRLRKHV